MPGLIERLFADSTVVIGPSRSDPGRQVATLNQATLAGLAGIRTAEFERFRWLTGDWRYENPVPATALSPAYCDVGVASFAVGGDGRWICAIAPDGREFLMITFDPRSRKWIYVLTNGSYGLLRSPGWTGNRIVFEGSMTLLGIECEWRMTWTRAGDDAFGFVNEEKVPDGSWSYIDEWRYWRR